MTIEPNKGVVLVELSASNYGNVPLAQKKFDSITSGIIIAFNKDDAFEYSDWLNRTGHWREYKDDARVKGPSGEKCAFIEIKDILGTSI